MSHILFAALGDTCRLDDAYSTNWNWTHYQNRNGGMLLDKFEKPERQFV